MNYMSLSSDVAIGQHLAIVKVIMSTGQMAWKALLDCLLLQWYKAKEKKKVWRNLKFIYTKNK